MSTLKKTGAAALAAIAGIYLSNPLGGVIEIIPDVIPVAGNLDEIVATIILLRCLLYLGIDPAALKNAAMRNVTPKKKIETDTKE